MKNQLLIASLSILLTSFALFNYNTDLSANDLVEFEQFKSTYGRTYTLEENIYRFGIFVNNLKKIATHNADKSQTYTLGVTQFSDMTTEEFIGIDCFYF